MNRVFLFPRFFTPPFQIGLLAISLFSSRTFANPEMTQVVDHVLTAENLASGATEEFHTLDPHKINVVVFLSSQCHCSKSHLTHLTNLYSQFPQVHFMAVVSNADENWNEARIYFSSAQIPFAVIADKSAALANAFRAIKTPDAFVFDENGRILYSGGVTDVTEIERAHHFYLQDALTAIQNHHPPRLSYAKALGCEIKR